MLILLFNSTRYRPRPRGLWTSFVEGIASATRLESERSAPEGSEDSMKHRSHRVLAWAASLFLVTVFAHAQDYLLQTGAPTFTTAEPVEMGFINASNGNLHM